MAIPEIVPEDFELPPQARLWGAFDDLFARDAENNRRQGEKSNGMQVNNHGASVTFEVSEEFTPVRMRLMMARAAGPNHHLAPYQEASRFILTFMAYSGDENDISYVSDAMQAYVGLHGASAIAPYSLVVGREEEPFIYPEDGLWNPFHPEQETFKTKLSHVGMIAFADAIGNFEFQ